ncbi:MAG: hypothetical protein GWN01_16060 [Nitrosopumilaceae archaeon]|nr:hypothetical protein [Nitrosopumilaceae archaeon]NIU02352.1 hypothetical protein [Nitrosopumilaceae archaeon]NIU88809.1 hypothetical protein [Nitrosopumilaceae archaeon]NIV66934.1 hypothetical protein [Nitrosopumilaceae archaeon]NIX62953.1 hypothetical protein [Nitrosopumilaceae archaeon]
MDDKNRKPYQIHLINSDENILEVFEQSKKYLESNKEVSSTIEEILWIFRALEDLLPQPLEKVWSGHMFPLVEASSDLENSIQLCKLGFYKSAMSSLRSVLELGILSVYWDIDDNSQINIQNWFRSTEKTPVTKDILTKLKINQNIYTFDERHKLFDDVKDLFQQLSNFTHTKGHLHSNQDLSMANINRFNEQALLKWLELMIKVVKFIVILHILKYPVALQHTPIEQKFGLNGPVGTFLQPHDVQRIRNFLDLAYLKTLQEISDNDPDAVSLANSINELPDISEEEFNKQIEEFEKFHSNTK